MNRKIKFRAWDFERKEMSSSFDLGFSQCYWMRSGKQVPIGRTHEATEEFALMQFTGLVDKDGTEIYEGDLVRFVIPNGVAKRDFIGRVEWDTVNPCFVIQDISDPNRQEYDFAVCGMAQIEVVGNIYETPELLEVPR